jgi:hypothetical protein
MLAAHHELAGYIGMLRRASPLHFGCLKLLKANKFAKTSAFVTQFRAALSRVVEEPEERKYQVSIGVFSVATFRSLCVYVGLFVCVGVCL